jgi:hypothetical protein
MIYQILKPAVITPLTKAKAHLAKSTRASRGGGNKIQVVFSLYTPLASLPHL